VGDVADAARPSTAKKVSAAIGIAGTIVALVVAGTTLFDWFGKKVDPPPPPPPQEVDARVLWVRFRNAGERLVDYLRDTDQRTDGLSTYEAAERGYVFLARLRLEGNLGKRVVVHWSVLDDRTARRLPSATYNQDSTALEPRGVRQTSTWPIWVPYPERKGRYRLRVTLVNERRQPIDERDSAPFRQTFTPST
jgi:hypothetical protein